MYVSLFRFILLSICYILIIELSKLILKIDLLIYKSLSTKLGEEQILEILIFQKKRAWLGFYVYLFSF